MPATRPLGARFRKLASTRLGTRVWTLGQVLILLAGLSITFAAFFMTGMRVATRARDVQVPDVVGQSLAEATTSLARVGLVLQVEQRRADPSVPADHVSTQDPDPGTTLRRQRAVRVRISSGHLDPEVPNVVGKLERTAEQALQQEEIVITGRAEIRSATYPPDTIVAQNPAAGQHAPEITLLVNRGEGGTTYVMPDVIGTLGDRTVQILRNRGFRVTVSAEVPYPGLPPGVVVRQTPQAGFQIGYGESVALEVSR